MINFILTLWNKSSQIRDSIGKIFSNKTIKLIFQFLWVGLIVVFIVIYTKRNWTEFRNYNWDFEVTWLLLAIFLALVRRLIGGLRWMFIAMDDKNKNSINEGILHLRTYFLSNMATYIPGTYWYMIGRIHMGKETGVSVKRTSLGLFYETILLILSGITVGIYAAVYVYPEYLYIIILILLLVVILWVALLSPRCTNYVLSIVSKLTNNKFQFENFNYRWGLVQLLLALLLWVSGGLSQFYLIKAFHINISYELIGYVLSTSALAWIIGFLAPWAPSGLGVREGMLVFLLEKFIPIQVCVVATIASRLVTVFEDIAWFIISIIFFRNR